MSVTLFETEAFDQLTEQACSSQRKRAHRNLHASLDEKCQRMLVAMEPDSYVPPHRHRNPAKPELLTILRGSICVLLFDDVCSITQVIRCEVGGSTTGCDLPPGVWHSIISLQTGTIFLEAKPGPYERLLPEDFGAWAPSENDATASNYLKQLHENASTQIC